MARTIDATTGANAEAAHVVPYLLVALEYPDEPVRVTSLPWDIDYAGDTYLGVGQLGSIGPVQEGTEIKSYGVQLRMSGIPLTYAAQVVATDGSGQPGRIWVGTLSADHRGSGEPVLLFAGRIDVHDIEIGETIAVTASLESRLIDWERAPGGRYTDQDQQDRYPGDRGLEYVAGVADMELVWGRG